MTRCCSLEPQRIEFNRVSLTYPMDSMKRFAQDIYQRHDRAFALHYTNTEALDLMAPCPHTLRMVSGIFPSRIMHMRPGPCASGAAPLQQGAREVTARSPGRPGALAVTFLGHLQATKIPGRL